MCLIYCLGVINGGVEGMGDHMPHLVTELLLSYLLQSKPRSWR